MAMCDDVHEEYGALANGDLQVGELPKWLHVHGRVAWWVYAGAYEGLPDAWRTFGERLEESGLESSGPPGDLYVCDPLEHEDTPNLLLTILWAPVL